MFIHVLLSNMCWRSRTINTCTASIYFLMTVLLNILPYFPMCVFIISQTTLELYKDSEGTAQSLLSLYNTYAIQNLLCSF